MSFIEIERRTVSMRNLHHRGMMLFADMMTGHDVDESEAVEALLGVFLAHSLRVDGAEDTVELLRKTANLVVRSQTSDDLSALT